MVNLVYLCVPNGLSFIDKLPYDKINHWLSSIDIFGEMIDISIVTIGLYVHRSSWNFIFFVCGCSKLISMMQSLYFRFFSSSCCCIIQTYSENFFWRGVFVYISFCLYFFSFDVHWRLMVYGVYFTIKNQYNSLYTLIKTGVHNKWK